MGEIDIDRIVQKIASAGRYRTVGAPLVRSLAAVEAPKARNEADAEKRTRRRLHQIFGAYVGQRVPYPAMRKELADATADPAQFREACRSVMHRHASTRERLPIIDGFYGPIFDRIGPVRRIVDLACGLNPLAIPWMPIDAQTCYFAYDIDAQLMEFLADAMGHMPVNGLAELRDVVGMPLEEAGDVALLLKSVPCLERQQPGSGYGLIDAAPAPVVVVSFPTRSLGGASKGMDKTYQAQFEASAAGRAWQWDRLDFDGELVFVVRKLAQPAPAG